MADTEGRAFRNWTTNTKRKVDQGQKPIGRSPLRIEPATKQCMMTAGRNKNRELAEKTVTREKRKNETCAGEKGNQKQGDLSHAAK